jgi:YHS domain-containing protein
MIMSITRSILTVGALIAVVAFTTGAGETKDVAKTEAPKELKNQTLCPVMGGKIDSTAYTDIQGQRVYHCCPGCSKQLKADPDKYFKKAAAESVLFENIQTTCPVGGEELKDKSVYTDYEGRRIAFCCEGCSGAFLKDPQTYLKKMDEKPEAATEERKTDHGAHDHSGHDH